MACIAPLCLHTLSVVRCPRFPLLSPAFLCCPSVSVNPLQAKRQKYSAEPHSVSTEYKHAAQIYAQMLGMVCHRELYTRPANQPDHQEVVPLFPPPRPFPCVRVPGVRFPCVFVLSRLSLSVRRSSASLLLVNPLPVGIYSAPPRRDILHLPRAIPHLVPALDIQTRIRHVVPTLHIQTRFLPQTRFPRCRSSLFRRSSRRPRRGDASTLAPLPDE